MPLSASFEGPRFGQIPQYPNEFLERALSAAGRGDADALRALVRRGWSVFDEPVWPQPMLTPDRRPLCVAVAGGSVDAVRVLLTNGARVSDGKPLEMAAALGHAGCVRILADYMDTGSEAFANALNHAILAGHNTLVAWMLTDPVYAGRLHTGWQRGVRVPPSLRALLKK